MHRIISISYSREGLIRVNFVSSSKIGHAFRKEWQNWFNSTILTLTLCTPLKFKCSFILIYYFSNLLYRCVECDKKFSVKRPPRLCDYTGLSFCPDCHWNAMAQTPARIIHNWDFSPRPVSQATKQYLFLMQRKPVIDISQANHKVST